MVKTAVEKVQDTGLVPKFMVCDQDPVHRSMFRNLGATNNNPSFSVNNQSIHTFYDSPHLLKSLRNTLRKYNIKLGNNVVSWKHVVNFFENDSKQKLKLAPKLTQRHIHKQGFSDMRVNLAAQVFSRTVAAGMYTQATFGILPQEAVHTAEFIYTIDRLFDCFNSATKYNFKEIRGAITKKFLSPKIY